MININSRDRHRHRRRRHTKKLSFFLLLSIISFLIFYFISSKIYSASDDEDDDVVVAVDDDVQNDEQLTMTTTKMMNTMNGREKDLVVDDDNTGFGDSERDGVHSSVDAITINTSDINSNSDEVHSNKQQMKTTTTKSMQQQQKYKHNSNHRIGGGGTGASKQLAFMNENVVQKLKDLAEKRIAVDVSRRSDLLFKGSFAMNRQRRKVNEEIPFPRKKLRDQLQHYSLGKAKKELIKVLPDKDDVRREKKSKLCAVIGNGGTLLAYDLGNEIDSADVIIRLNAGPIKGFERKVGSRTDYRLVNRLHMGFRETKEEMVLQHCTTPDALDEWMRYKLKQHTNDDADDDDTDDEKTLLYAIDPDFHEFAISYTDKGVVSNGFYGLLLATELCETVKVYGFFRKWKGNVNYHYYNAEAPNEGQSFRDDKEGDRLDQWLKERRNTHKMGEPCLQQEDYDNANDDDDDDDDTVLSSKKCENCKKGFRCVKSSWHPVPLKGYCYDEKYKHGRGMPNANCARKCPVNEPCSGGKRGFCSKSTTSSVDCSI
jgi:hypothetical protein